MASNTTDTPEIVVQEATQSADLTLSRLMLIGTAGADGAMNGLVRLAGGRILRVVQGDRVDGGTVASITPGRLLLLRRGRQETLSLPAL